MSTELLIACVGGLVFALVFIAMTLILRDRVTRE